MEPIESYTAFAGDHLVASGDLATMLVGTKAFLDRNPDRSVLIFDDRTGRQVDFDFRGAAAEVLERAGANAPKGGPGRPKLGVVSREVSLLPRQWEWLENQPNGISAALRRLVDEARKREPGKERARLVREAASRFMWVLAGDRPGFEEASRALFARDDAALTALMADWPTDIREHLARMVAEAASLESDS